MTQFYDFRQNINDNEIRHCGKAIKEGGLVIFPTETVYGIGANALLEEATKKIYTAKGRASDNPLIVHISNYNMIEEIAEISNEIEAKLISSFMPGPFTIILKKKDVIPHTVSAGLETVGVRMPSNEIARRLIEEAGVPIAAPSANISGRPSGTTLQDIKEEFDGKVDAMIDGGVVTIGLESTVVKVIDGTPTILRPGKVTLEDIQKVIAKAKVSDNVMNEVQKDQKVESPGMKYRHYAPKTECILIKGERQEQIQKIQDKLRTTNACVVGFKEDKEEINAKHFVCLGSRINLEEVAKNLFMKLRKADSLGVKLILIQGTKEEGLGLAIMNRLIRACEYKVI